MRILIFILLPIMAASQDAAYFFPVAGFSIGDDVKARVIAGVGFEYQSEIFRFGFKGEASIIEETLLGGFGVIGGIQESKERWGFGMQLTVGYKTLMDVQGPALGMGVNIFMRTQGGVIYRLVPEIYNVWDSDASDDVKGFFALTFEVPIKI